MNADLHVARAEYNRLRLAAGHPPSTAELTAAIGDALARTNARPGEPHHAADELAVDVFTSLPLDEQAAMLLADGAHRGRLRALARRIADHMVGAPGERQRLEPAHEALMTAVSKTTE